MKFTYDSIKENLRIYSEAKKQLPIITEYENGSVSHSVMRNLGLEKFAEFHQFLKHNQSLGFDLIKALTYKELKDILIENTKSQRFKVWLKNRTSKYFTKLIQDDSQTFDRLINGRWIIKPGYTNRGRRSWGRRSNEFIEAFDVAFVPLINWIITNDINTCENYQSDIYKKFTQQDKFFKKINWYLSVELNLDSVPTKEIEITHNLLTSLVDFVEDTKIDFRKLNSDLIIDSLQTKIRKLMSVDIGTSIRSIEDFNSIQNSPRLIKGKNYIVENSSISNGFLRVMISDESGYKNWYDYRQFEDKSIDRDLLLSQLGF